MGFLSLLAKTITNNCSSVSVPVLKNNGQLEHTLQKRSLKDHKTLTLIKSYFTDAVNEMSNKRINFNTPSNKFKQKNDFLREKKFKGEKYIINAFTNLEDDKLTIDDILNPLFNYLIYMAISIDSINNNGNTARMMEKICILFAVAAYRKAEAGQTQPIQIAKIGRGHIYIGRTKNQLPHDEHGIMVFDNVCCIGLYKEGQVRKFKKSDKEAQINKLESSKSVKTSKNGSYELIDIIGGDYWKIRFLHSERKIANRIWCRRIDTVTPFNFTVKCTKSGKLIF